jgi:hypothetical protein
MSPKMRLAGIIGVGSSIAIPFGSLPFFLFLKRLPPFAQCFIFSNFFAAVFYSLFPWGDGYVRFEMFERAVSFTYLQFTLLGLSSGDIAFSQIAYLIQSLNLPYQWVQYIFVFLGTFIIYVTYLEIMSKKSQTGDLIVILTLIALINFVGMALNQRYMLSVSLCLLASVRSISNSQKPKNIYWLMAFLSHFASILIFFIFQLSRLIPLINPKIFYLLIGILGFVVVTFSANYILDILQYFGIPFGFVTAKLVSYTQLPDHRIDFMISSPGQFLHFVIRIIPLFLLSVIVSRTGSQANLDKKVFFFGLSFLISILFYYAIFLRVFYFYLLLGFFIHIKNADISSWKSSRSFILFISILCFSAANYVVAERHFRIDKQSIINRKMLCSVFSPIPLMSKCAFSNGEIRSGNSSFRDKKRASQMRRMKLLRQSKY